MTPLLAGADGSTLLHLARRSMEAAVTGEPPPPAVGAAILERRAGAFVTLTVQRELRGCIGYSGTRGRLGDVIVECARAAALDDPRFPPVSVPELTAIAVEVSVLTPLSGTRDPALIEVGRHGLYVSHHGRRGLLLPQVAVEWGWTREEFLEQTCRKAGLPRDAWRRGAQIFTFEAEIFSETDVHD